VLYLGTSPNDDAVRPLLDSHRIGLMSQPGSNPPRPGWVWAADNGCFNARWDHDQWARWLARDMPRSGCLFATVPDVVADHAATLDRFNIHARTVADARYPIAFVGQDGASIAGIPWSDIDCLFIGGSTDWKLSERAFALAGAARDRGKWVHVGRVNSNRRFAAWAPHADSCDGTFLAFGPTKNAPRLERWIADAWTQPALTLTTGEHA
jgi:hypothetical protein